MEARRSTWDGWNLHAEASRVLRGVRMRNPAERVQLTDRVVAAAAARCLPLDGDAGTVHLDAQRPGMERRYTSAAILAAEQALLAGNTATHGPSVPDATAEAAVGVAIDAGEGQVRVLAVDQRAAVVEIAASGRPVDVLVGPAGTGKTVTLAVLRRAWQTRHGHGSVLGLAPSAAAAGELAAALAVPCETTAKWLWETSGPGAGTRIEELNRPQQRLTGTADARQAHRAAAAIKALVEEQRRWRLHPGQLVIVDEAAMAATVDLARLTAQTTAAGAKLLLVRDHRQHGPVDAGGAFGAPRPGRHRRHLPHRHDRGDDPRGLVRRDDPRPSDEHRLCRHRAHRPRA